MGTVSSTLSDGRRSLSRCGGDGRKSLSRCRLNHGKGEFEIRWKFVSRGMPANYCVGV